MRPTTRPARVALAVLVPLLLVAAACAPTDESAGGTGQPSGSGGSGGSGASPAACDEGGLPTIDEGTLTIGTDSPAYPPWFAGNDPTNGKGYESAVAYAVAGELGLSDDQVSWVKVPFNSSYAPGAKPFDFDINQISITPEREQAVDFSSSYYSTSQAIIALKGTPAAEATTLEELKGYQLGAQTGTTSLTALRALEPEKDPLVFKDNNTAKQAIANGQLDAIVTDLPTAFYITAVEIPDGVIVGQFADEDNADQFGMLFEKGNPLVDCVDQALARLEQDGTLADLEQQWLSDVTDVPVLSTGG